MSEPKKPQKLDYGEGQREQYGEGAGYKPEDKTPAADELGQSNEFAGGERPNKGASEGAKPEKSK